MKSKMDTLVGEKPVATVTYQERLWRLFNRFGPAIMLMAVVAGMSIAHPDFLTISNLMTIGLQAAVRALLAIGELLVVISGGIDLSVGTAMSLSMVTMGLYVSNSHGSLEIGMLIAIATGVLVGLVNGTLVAFLGLPPFIITLGMLGIAQGLALTLSSGFSMYGFPKEFDFLGGGQISSSWPSWRLLLRSSFVRRSWGDTPTPSGEVKRQPDAPAFQCDASRWPSTPSAAASSESRPSCSPPASIRPIRVSASATSWTRLPRW